MLVWKTDVKHITLGTYEQEKSCQQTYVQLKCVAFFMCWKLHLILFNDSLKMHIPVIKH